MIYDLEVDDQGRAKVGDDPDRAELSGPPALCRRLVEKGVMNVPGITACEVELTWDPPWSLEKASEDARLALGM